MPVPGYTVVLPNVTRLIPIVDDALASKVALVPLPELVTESVTHALGRVSVSLCC